MTRVKVDSMCYLTAADRFGMANSDVVGAVQRLAGALGGCGGMAGNDTGGKAWANKYDPAASQLLRAGAQMGEALGKAGSLLAASGSNHEHADAASRTSGGGGYNAPVPTPPDFHYQTIAAPSPPSAAGGTGDVPGWWHWIASHVGGLLWPDADTGKLRSAGDAWTSAGSSITSAAGSVLAASAQISGERSPEVPDVETACSNLSRQLDQLGSAYTSIGHACHEYADAVDQHHQMIFDELKSFIEWTVAIEAGSAVVGFFTFGGGEAAGQAIEGAEVANAASKVVKILTSLIEIARLGAAKLADLIETASTALEGVKGLLSARVVKAIETIAPSLARSEKLAAMGKDLPELKGTIAESFEGGKYTEKTFKAGTVFYRAEGADQGIGSFFGTVKPGSATEAEKMFNIAKWGNSADVVTTYRLRENLTMYFGDVAGGSGEQALLPRGLDANELFEKVSREPLK